MFVILCFLSFLSSRLVSVTTLLEREMLIVERKYEDEEKKRSRSVKMSCDFNRIECGEIAEVCCVFFLLQFSSETMDV